MEERSRRALLRTAAAMSAVAGLGFGVPGCVGLAHFARYGQVWTFLGFPTYGSGPFESIGVPTSVPLLGAFVAVCAAEVVTAALLWRDRRAGRVLAVALLPAELVFWVGFALPFGPPLGIARALAGLAADRSCARA